MTKDEREESLEAAREGYHFLRKYIESQIESKRLRGQISALLDEFERLDAKEQKQIKAGRKYGKLGAKHGAKGGRPRKEDKK